MSDPIDNLRRHVDASTALGSDRTAVLVADLRIALNRLAAAEARASGAEAEVERVRDEAVQSDRNAVATYIRAAAARMEHEPTILLCDLADDIEGGNHADAVSPSVALTSPAPPPAGVAYQAPDGACGREYVKRDGRRDGKPCVRPSGEHSWCRDLAGEEWHFLQGVGPTAAGDGLGYPFATCPECGRGAHRCGRRGRVMDGKLLNRVGRAMRYATTNTNDLTFTDEDAGEVLAILARYVSIPRRKVVREEPTPEPSEAPKACDCDGENTTGCPAHESEPTQ